MSSLTEIERGHLINLTKELHTIYEEQKPFLACNTSPPSERNAYFALSNAIRMAAGKRMVRAATEVVLKKKRRIDAAFLIDKTLYIVELKVTTARIVAADLRKNGKSRKGSKSAETIKKVTKQLDGIKTRSKFVRHVIATLDVSKIVLVGVVIANIRAIKAKKNPLTPGELSKIACDGFAKKWISRSSKAKAKRYQEIVAPIQHVNAIERTTAGGRIQFELGSIVYTCARVRWKKGMHAVF